MSLVFSHQSSSDITEGRHIRLSLIISFNQFTLRNFGYYFIFFLWRNFNPLHSIDSESCPEWFGENDFISWLGVIWHKEFIILYNSNSCSSHHWPHIVDSLTTSNLGLSFLSGISESLNHKSCCNILLFIVHLG